MSSKSNTNKQAVRSAERAVDAVFFYWKPNSERAKSPREAVAIIRREAEACAKIGRKLVKLPGMPPALARTWNARAQALRWAAKVIGVRE